MHSCSLSTSLGSSWRNHPFLLTRVHFRFRSRDSFGYSSLQWLLRLISMIGSRLWRLIIHRTEDNFSAVFLYFRTIIIYILQTSEIFLSEVPDCFWVDITNFSVISIDAEHTVKWQEKFHFSVANEDCSFLQELSFNILWHWPLIRHVNPNHWATSTNTFS